MVMSPAIFFAGVSGLIRIGRTAQDSYRAHLREHPIDVLLPGFKPTRAELESAAMYELWNFHRALCDAGRFDGLFLPSDGVVNVNPDAPRSSIEAALEFYLEQHNLPLTVPIELNGETRAASSLLVLTHKDWLDPNQPSRWARLGLDLANTALDIAALQPEALGLSRRTTELVGALATNMTELVDNDDLSGDPGTSAGERLVKLFFRASVETIAERPEIFVSEERWRPLVAGVVTPLSEALKANPDPSMEFLTQDRLRALFTGPIAHSVLTALDANADSFLSGRAGGDKALGAVVRTVLGAIASTDQADFDLKAVLSGDGAAMVLQSAFKVAQERPELFVHGLGAEKDAKRQFLRKVVGTLQDAPRPYHLDSGLAAQLASVSLEVAGDYAGRRIRENAGEGLWSEVGADVADNIVGEVLSGFKAALAGGDASGGATNAFERVFSPDQAVDVVRIIASHVAATPEMLVGDASKPEVRNIAAGVASLIAEDAKGLLDGEDWRRIVAKAMECAAANPGALFDIGRTDAPERQVAVALVSGVLSRAADNMGAGRRPGAILFGDTLREAIAATLSAASTNLVTAPAGADAAAGLDGHVAALERFVDTLLQLANGDDRDLRMSASEWIYVYRYFVADVVAKGPDAAVTPEQVFAVLQSLDAAPNKEEVVG